MSNSKCPDCGLEYDRNTFRQEVEGNRTFFVCPNNHKNEIGKTGNNEWEFKYSYPFKPLKQKE